MEILSINSPDFSAFGCVHEGFDCAPLLRVLMQRPCPADVLYVPSDRELEALPVSQQLQQTLFGQMPVQVGFTNGHCRRMNALEYHKSSELNIATEDVILFLAARQELSAQFTMDSSSVKAFLLPKGVLVEIYATTLHYAPCQTSDAGYRCIVVLPAGTNLPLAGKTVVCAEDPLLAATNKWLIGHPEGGLPGGSFLGIRGKNLEV